MADLTAHLDSYEALTAQIDDLEIKRGQLLMQMRNTLTVEEATIYEDHPKYTVRLTSKTEWNEPSLSALREFLSEEEVARLKNTPKAPTFDKRKLNSLAKRGGEIGKVIRAAQTEGALEISVKEKK